jgi:hypothetical protein
MRFNLAVALTLATVCAGTAFGDTINFSNPTGPLGHFQVYNAGPNSVTAYAFNYNGNSSGTSRNLYGKNGSGSEKGVGIDGTHDNEITTTTFLQLDITNIIGQYSLLIGSTQNTEGFRVCFGDTLGLLGGACSDFPNPGSDPFTTSSFTKGTKYLSIRADGEGQGNVLLDSLTTSAVPEPSSLLLLGTGIIGAAGVLRRKLSA